MAYSLTDLYSVQINTALYLTKCDDVARYLRSNECEKN